MRKIKSFKLFESGKVDPYAKMWHTFKTIKALEYILVEEGYRIRYDFLFIDSKSMGKYYTSVPESSVRMSEDLGTFAGFRLEISYQRDLVSVNTGGQILTKEQIAKLAVDTEKYSDLLREDLEGEVESVKWFSVGQGESIIKVIL